MMRYSILVLVFVVFAGCSYNVALNTDIRPNTYVNQKYTTLVGVIIPDELKSYEARVHPSSGEFNLDNYKFNIGETLHAVFVRSTQVAYRNVVEMNNTYNDKLDRVILYSLLQCDIDLDRLEVNDQASSAVAIGIEVYDAKTRELLRWTTVAGNGFSSDSSVSTSSRKAINYSLQQVADNLATLLVSGFAEPGTEQTTTTTEQSSLVDVIHLKSGNTVEGALISNQDDFVEIKLQDDSVVTIEKERIDRIETLMK